MFGWLQHTHDAGNTIQGTIERYSSLVRGKDEFRDGLGGKHVCAGFCVAPWFMARDRTSLDHLGRSQLKFSIREHTEL